MSTPRLFIAFVCGLLAVFTVSVISTDATAASRKRASRAAPKGSSCPVSGTRSVGFAKALDGATFVASDGTEIRLAGVLAPAESAAEAARASLAASLRNRSVTLSVETAPDRYGRVAAQVFSDGVWVQGALLKIGALRVAPDVASASCGRELVAAEDEALGAHAGHWRDGAFSLRTPDQVGNRIGTFQTVEGTVTTATTYKGRAYINFGADYRTDFTVTIAPADMKAFRTARFDVKKLAGKRVRVRGWVELYNGPEMQIAMPVAIQTLD